MKNYSPYHFSIFRMVFGLYLLVHFLFLVPNAAEVWSNVGVLSDASLNLTHGFFPSILNYFDAPIFVTGFVIGMAILSLLFLLGFQRNLVAIFLWYGWVCLFDRNNLINNPGIPFLGWLLLVCAVVPKGEPLTITKQVYQEERWQLPSILFYGAWIIMALSYTLSGLDKLGSPSWYDGTAVIHLLENPLARDWWLRTFLLGMPEVVLHIMTWGILVMEIIFLPLALLPKTRPWIWLGMILMHFGILLIVDFADLTLGMLMIHWFTFDDRWLFGSKEKLVAASDRGIVFFDGICGICNGFVDFAMSEDQMDQLTFAPLQGSTAQEKIPGLDASELDSIYYYKNGQLSKESDAVLQILSDMGGIWKLGVVLRIFPRGLRDWVYGVIAKNRYRWFGKKEACRIPTVKERGKILF